MGSCSFTERSAANNHHRKLCKNRATRNANHVLSIAKKLSKTLQLINRSWGDQHLHVRAILPQTLDIFLSKGWSCYCFVICVKYHWFSMHVFSLNRVLRYNCQALARLICAELKHFLRINKFSALQLCTLRFFFVCTPFQSKTSFCNVMFCSVLTVAYVWCVDFL